ncbi:hypothetical protein CMV_005289 [Castanea mollissima]|uniref:Uncharacterized protein n=1 Tax=Castanea mollissima TaxID=60419 RepID=A0A8J4VUN6_9ROSI|nr:hypothetical protein CMV_005289 [Castanea mollissima]
MDTVYVTAKMDTFSKSVEEMSINSEEPPQEYIVKDCSFGSIASSDPSPGSIPIIDISIFSLHDPKEVGNALEKLRSALSFQRWRGKKKKQKWKTYGQKPQSL